MYKILLCFMLFIGVGFSAAAQNPQKGDYVQFEKKFDCGPLCSTPLFVIEGYVTYYHDGFLTIKVSAVLPTSGQTYTERDWEIAHRIVIGEELSYAYSEYYNLKILKEGAFHDQYEQEEEREKAERDRAREAWMKSLREERAALLKDIDVKTKAWSDTYNKPYVDLGLPSGTLWATVNVGARKPWETGNRYAWGETSPKSEYTASSYRYAKGHQERALLGNVTVYEPTKYNGHDKKIRLDLSDDAAYVNMGSEWCTPTQEQVNELYAYCILTSTTNYHGTGISGTLICRKDNLSVHIFIPDGDYWFNQITSYKDLSILTCSYGDNTFSNTASGNSNARYVGNYVRAVKRSKQDLEAENAMQAKINNQAVNWVNLGLPSGTLWAVFNVGTNNYDNPGEKFALENYRIRNTEWRNEDPVKTYMGENWRMPTKAEWDELMQYCTKHGYSDGLVFKSKINGQTIGFPCDASGKGYYWSSTLIDDRNMYSGELQNSYSGYLLEFDINKSNVGVVKGLISRGCYVRGVLVNKATAKLINDAAHKKWDNLKAQGKPYENVPLLRGEIYIYFLGGEAMSNSTTTPTNRTSNASNDSNPSQTNITSNTNNPSQTNAPSNTNINSASEEQWLAEVESRGQYGYGADSVECIRLLSNYQECVKQKNYTDAYPIWSVLFKKFPKSDIYIYSYGVNIIKLKMKDAVNSTEQQKWIDTLMMVYDRRIRFFAATSKKYGEGYILGRKGVDMVKYRPHNPIDEPYVILNKSVDLQQEKSEVAVILSAMQVTIKMYNANKINAEQVRDNYNKYLRLLTVIKNNGDSNADLVIDNIKSLYQQSNIGN